MKNLSIKVLALFTALNLGLYAQKKTVIATYYADKFHGRKTTSGSKYNRDSLTCAHKTLRFGTKVLVTNPKNNQSVVVKVTDRGPWIKGRTIDLSARAAKTIGIMGLGIARVEMTVLDGEISEKELPVAADSVKAPDSIAFRQIIQTLAPDTPYLSYKKTPIAPIKLHDFVKKQYRVKSSKFFI